MEYPKVLEPHGIEPIKLLAGNSVNVPKPDKSKPVTLQELVLYTLAMADAVTKLLIEKGVITEAEFKQKLL